MNKNHTISIYLLYKTRMSILAQFWQGFRERVGLKALVPYVVPFVLSISFSPKFIPSDVIFYVFNTPCIGENDTIGSSMKKIDSVLGKRVLIAALPEKPKLLEIIWNDLCSYSGSDIPRVSYKDFLFFTLSQDFGPIKNLLLTYWKTWGNFEPQGPVFGPFLSFLSGNEPIGSFSPVRSTISRGL